MKHKVHDYEEDFSKELDKELENKLEWKELMKILELKESK